MADDPASAALAALEQALAKRPHKDDALFAEATGQLVILRDRLIARQRGGEDQRAALSRVNGIISAVLGGHFPLGHIPWSTLDAARDALAPLAAGRQGESNPSERRSRDFT